MLNKAKLNPPIFKLNILIMPWFSAHQMAQLASLFYKNTLLKETGFRKVSEQVYCYKTPHTGHPKQQQKPLL